MERLPGALRADDSSGGGGLGSGGGGRRQRPAVAGQGAFERGRSRRRRAPRRARGARGRAARAGRRLRGKRRVAPDVDGPNATLDALSAAAAANASLNGSAPGLGAAKGFCLEWEAAQHNLFQTANLFFAAAFLVPRSFKQSLLLLRALLCVGFFLSALWAGLHVCSPDVFAWNTGLVVLNALHAALLAARHLPPPLSLELAELYLKLFKPLRVSRKHFKELTREGQVLRLQPGDTYAVEEVTAADERLSVLLRGKLRVTCDDTHLHYISPHQFIDSPEWEANHDTSDDVFQVTITAEQECVYICWPRIKLERVLRHRPLLKTVLDNIIGKDITHKLYSLNEQLALAGAAAVAEAAAAALSRPADHWRHAMSRSLSVDAVHTGTRGHVRSLAWRQSSHRTSSALTEGNLGTYVNMTSYTPKILHAITPTRQKSVTRNVRIVFLFLRTHFHYNNCQLRCNKNIYLKETLSFEREMYGDFLFCIYTVQFEKPYTTFGIIKFVFKFNY
ncbi:Blood vessel epicardial substance [Gryllus bimaculatus]|nr:Blood vessel epicardial substance [Gryllus bimaculatus]